MTICCFFYNIPHLFELQSIPCIDERFNLESLQICPTEFRMNSLYYTIYYTYMYTTFMAVGPLLLLILLNICVVVTVLTKGADGMFIFSNTVPLPSGRVGHFRDGWYFFIRLSIVEF